MNKRQLRRRPNGMAGGQLQATSAPTWIHTRWRLTNAHGFPQLILFIRRLKGFVPGARLQLNQKKICGNKSRRCLHRLKPSRCFPATEDDLASGICNGGWGHQRERLHGPRCEAPYPVTQGDDVTPEGAARPLLSDTVHQLFRRPAVAPGNAVAVHR